MAEISTWSTTASNNNASPPDGFPEGMTPSSVNDSARELMAAIRRWYEDAAWVDFGLSYTRISSGSFSLTGDYTSTHHVGRRVKMSGSSTTYGTIGTATYSAPTTTIELLESTVPATLDSVALSIIEATNSPMPYGLDAFPRLSASNTFTGATTTLSSTQPTLRFYESDAITDEKYWRIVSTGGQWVVQAIDDAYVTGSTPLLFNRAGTTVTTCEIEAASISLTATGGVDLYTTTGTASMGSTGTWAFSNGTVTGNIGYSVTPTFQLGTSSAHAFDLYSNGTTRLTLKSDGAITTQVFTVATLPSAVNGGRAFVSDANATTFASIVAPGGSNRVPVYSDGTNWRIG